MAELDAESVGVRSAAVEWSLLVNTESLVADGSCNEEPLLPLF